MHRLHIDIPLDMPLEDAQKVATEFMDSIFERLRDNSIKTGMAIHWYYGNPNDRIQVNYRLGDDRDRSNRNYLNVDENGHASTKKLGFWFTGEDMLQA